MNDVRRSEEGRSSFNEMERRLAEQFWRGVHKTGPIDQFCGINLQIGAVFPQLMNN